jgi:hypothetical protein
MRKNLKFKKEYKNVIEILPWCFWKNEEMKNEVEFTYYWGFLSEVIFIQCLMFTKSFAYIHLYSTLNSS